VTPPSPNGVLGGRRILIVDDDYEIRRLLRCVFEMEGALVTEADSAKAAADVAVRAGCDVVLTDITMGHTRRDGIRLLDWFRGSPTLAKIPVVAITGCRELRSELLARGFDDVLIKPLDVFALIPTLVTLRDAA